MSFGDFDKTVINFVSRNRVGRFILLASAAVGLLVQIGSAFTPSYNFVKERFVLLAGVEPSADQIKSERYVFLSGFYLRFVQDYLPYSATNSDRSQLFASAESRLGSTFEGTGFKYSTSELTNPELTLPQRLNALQTLRSRAEVNADRLGERYRALFDFGYYIAAMLQKTAEIEVRNISINELNDLAVSSYGRAKEGVPYKLPDLAISKGECKGDRITNHCVVDVVATVNRIKAYLRVKV